MSDADARKGTEPGKAGRGAVAGGTGGRNASGSGSGGAARRTGGGAARPSRTARPSSSARPARPTRPAKAAAPARKATANRQAAPGSPAPKPAKRRRIVITWGGTKGRPNRLTGRAGVLALVVCVLAIALVVPVRQYISQQREREDLREQTRDHREEVERLREELERWKDPAYVRQQARMQLHYVNPGDVAYSVVPPPAPTTSPDDAAKPKGDWPDSLWTTVREADAKPTPSTAPQAPPPPPDETITDPRSGGR
ncbi:FtsB family cell division protein [Streptodolium elevatio]|uniref:Septum formation initiator family protein n=1 Tax=Streptodolium elevatio TaxID=3157996 RepID=A0ABV3DKC1_9ACTN